MSWPPSDDDESAASARDDGAEGLRQLLIYFYITETPIILLKSFERRRDGGPIVEGMARPDSRDGKDAWRSFEKNVWRNVGIAVERRRKHPKHHSAHTNSLPLHYSPFEFIRPRRQRCPELPSWTQQHYESQFNSTMASTRERQFEQLKAMVCRSLIGRTVIDEVGGETDGKDIDLHLKTQTSPNGQALFNLMGDCISILRTPRGAKSDRSDNAAACVHDILSVSKMSGDTFTASQGAVIPYTLVDDNSKLVFTLYSSNAMLLNYFAARQGRVNSDVTATEARKHAEQAFLIEAQKQPSVISLTISIEIVGVKFVPKALQDARLTSADPKLISTSHHYVHGLMTDVNGIDGTPYGMGGNDVTLVIAGRDDSMEKEETANEILRQRLEDLRLEGEFLLLLHLPPFVDQTSNLLLFSLCSIPP